MALDYKSHSGHQLCYLAVSNRSFIKEFFVNSPHTILEAVFRHADDDAHLASALIDHPHVRTDVTHGREQLSGNAGPVDHAAAHHGDHGKTVADVQHIRVHLLLDILHQHIPAICQGGGWDHQREGGNAGGHMLKGT